MSLPWIWFALAGLALVGEVLSGTFYLLIIAAAMVLAGIAAWFGLTFALQLVVCAVGALLGVLVLRRTGVLGKRGKTDSRRDANVNIDIGQRLSVEVWQADRTARARYRGAEWNVMLAPDADPLPGTYVIVEVRGTHLIVKPA